MTKLLTSCVAAAFSLVCATARAEIVSNPDDIVAAVRAKRSGAWLDDVALKRCLEADVRAEGLENTSKIVLQQRDAAVSEGAHYMQALGLAESENALLKQQVDGQGRLVSNLQRDLDAWYRNPLIMGGAGAAVGVVVTFVLFAYVHR